MNIKTIQLIYFCFIIQSAGLVKSIPKGNLFVIGGGDRSAELMRTLIKTAGLENKDHIAILPMSSAEPDTSYYYIKIDFEQVCNNTIAYLNFTKDKMSDRSWLDSLKKAKIIFITGR
jgi:cyanophycinase